MNIELRNHTENLQSIVIDFSCFLGLNDKDINTLKLVAKYHDIGKKFIADEILFKRETLTSSEVKILKTHPVKSFTAIMSNPSLSFDIAYLSLLHHERIDGTGYPLGLTGDKIPRLTKIITICDSYEAMIGTRCYRRQLSIKEALGEIESNLNTQFDYALGKQFIEFITKNNCL